MSSSKKSKAPQLSDQGASATKVSYSSSIYMPHRGTADILSPPRRSSEPRFQNRRTRTRGGGACVRRKCFHVLYLSLNANSNSRLVLSTLNEALAGEPDRKCFRLIGGVLVERTVKDVVPALQTNRDGVSLLRILSVSNHRNCFLVRYARSLPASRSNTKPRKGSSRSLRMTTTSARPVGYNDAALLDIGSSL